MDEAEPETTLDLRGKALTEVPRALAASLTSLDLSHNALKADGSLGSLGSLVRLRSLDLSHNALVTLPPALGALGSLERLDVRHNALTALPAALGEAALQLLASHNPLALDLAPPGSDVWCDADFPATAASLFCEADAPWAGHPDPNGGVRWLRPHEIAAAAGAPPPALFVDASASTDVVQGLLGDCWLLSAIAVVALRPELLKHIFAYAAVEGGRAGCLTLQLWRSGRWEKVRVDDRLPCGSDGRLLYAHSTDSNEMWVR